MRRREFITLLGGAAAAWPIAARGRSRRVASSRVLGGLSQYDQVAMRDRDAFVQGLRERGYEDGQQRRYHLPMGGRRYLAVRSRTDLVALDPAVIFGSRAIGPTTALKPATSIIPIV